tara:strand:- start:1211 stop:1540 length:330 start_codon:yes stop_codon:yes gene_type:complete
MRFTNLKICSKLLLLLFFNGCVQSSAFLGPAVTVAGTGSLSHGGLSYGSNKIIKNITGKTPTENIKEMLQLKEKENRTIKLAKENDNRIIKLTKEKINKAGKIKDLSSL